MPEREEGRELLTDEMIKRDLRAEACRFLLGGAVAAPAILLLVLVVFFILSKAPRGPLFWLAAAVFGATGLFVLWGCLFNLYRAARYFAAARRGRFTVAEDVLGAKEEGYRGMMRPNGLFTHHSRPHKYVFHGAVVKVPTETVHFSKWKGAAMTSWELFGRSREGDGFWLVSLQPGKPALIYPQDLFDYGDPSPV